MQAFNTKPSLDGKHMDLLAVFVAIALESLLVGIFIVLGSISLYLWTTRMHGSSGFILEDAPLSKRKPATLQMKESIRGLQMAFKNPLVYGSVALSICILGHWICTVVRLFTAVEILQVGQSPIPMFEDHRRTDFILMSTFIAMAFPVVDSLLPILVILVESAALHSVWTVLGFVTYQAEMPLAIIALETGPVVAGIAFMLINVRVGLGWDIRPDLKCGPLPFILAQAFRGTPMQADDQDEIPNHVLHDHPRPSVDGPLPGRVSMSIQHTIRVSTQSLQRHNDDGPARSPSLSQNVCIVTGAATG
ncbi:hypothetical protein FA15DRAFT_703837 [Coprinopsis marcescibilis]|uniref:Uncharacterized protein n=1 Tax=Coprinopsis marcescibilis TaxID=230819 RepID=A0A5C3KYM2_COPMA|nr:hypothetical protein FA15DRAFT_703837 [Coprinopsis marcescibilis]